MALSGLVPFRSSVVSGLLLAAAFVAPAAAQTAPAPAPATETVSTHDDWTVR